MRKVILSYLRKFPIDYGKQRLVNLIKLPEGQVIYKNPHGVTFKLDMSDHVMRQIYLRGTYEKNTFRHLLMMLKPDSVFIDVGANVGAYSVGLSPYLKEGKIIAFEPNPKALEFLEENIRLNKVENITVNKIGLSNKEETAILYSPNLTTASINKHVNSNEGNSIQLTTLDRYCSENNIDQVNLLKIDVEGHEFKVLEGALDTIKRSNNLILVMEIDDNVINVGKKKSELFDYVKNLGFRAYIPKGYPFRKKEIQFLKEDYKDNVIFVKNN